MKSRPKKDDKAGTVKEGRIPSRLGRAKEKNLGLTVSQVPEDQPQVLGF